MISTNIVITEKQMNIIRIYVQNEGFGNTEILKEYGQAKSYGMKIYSKSYLELI